MNLKEGGNDYSYLYDGKGNVMVVIDNNQQPVSYYRYDVFGVPMKKVGTFNQPFRFSTKRYDEATGLYNFGYRFHNPTIGRWLTRDPLGEAGGINLYGFVANNPINFVDPWGLIVLYRGGGGAVGAGYKVNPTDQDPVTFMSGQVVHYGGTNKSGEHVSGMAATGGAGRMVGVAAGGGVVAGINFGDVEDLSGSGTSTGLLFGPFSFELTLDGDGQSVTGFSFGFLNKGIGLGYYGQQTLTKTFPFNGQGTQAGWCK